MQVFFTHYGCWQFIIQTKPEQPDEEATYKEKIRSTTSNSSLPCNKSTDGKKRTSELSKIEAELILEANRLQLMKQDLRKRENAYLSSFTSKKSKTLPGAAAHGDPNGKNDYQKKGGKPDHYIIPKSKEISFFSDVTAKTKNGSIEIGHQRFGHVNNDYLVKTSKNDSVKGLPRLTDSDLDFATNRDDRVSMGRFITFIDETPFLMANFQAKSVSLSTMEAEYVSLTEAAKEFIFG
ncbi:retrovirus-related Pol polyprotein from transposon TNT 1-94 [Trichonephila clavipes]|nr:retrovirus-related Pol polyprotein from transposon TNT 1-94 [Trichonephila clavipes]